MRLRGVTGRTNREDSKSERYHEQLDQLEVQLERIGGGALDDWVQLAKPTTT